jgi:hypothetical protein
VQPRRWREREPAAGALVPGCRPNDRLFLWTAAFAPIVGTCIVALTTQTALQSRWGANGFLLSGLWLMALVRPGDTAGRVRRAVHATAALQIVLCLGMTLGKTVIAERLGVTTRANFPGAVLAERARETWKAAVPQAPLRLVVSDIWLGGNIVANTHSSVAVLIDGHRFKSPWVNRDAVTACGALVLDDLTEDSAGRNRRNPALDALMEHADASGVWSLPWRDPNCTRRTPFAAQCAGESCFPMRRSVVHSGVDDEVGTARSATR